MLFRSETHICALISADGARCEHLILLPDDFEGTWKESLDWAESIGGHLPNRVEGALLFAHAKDEFHSLGTYWTRDLCMDVTAWYMDFFDGYQGRKDPGKKAYACAIRRSRIEPLSHQVAT